MYNDLRNDTRGNDDASNVDDDEDDQDKNAEMTFDDEFSDIRSTINNDAKLARVVLKRNAHNL